MMLVPIVQPALRQRRGRGSRRTKDVNVFEASVVWARLARLCWPQISSAGLSRTTGATRLDFQPRLLPSLGCFARSLQVRDFFGPSTPTPMHQNGFAVSSLRRLVMETTSIAHDGTQREMCSAVVQVNIEIAERLSLPNRRIRRHDFYL